MESKEVQQSPTSLNRQTGSSFYKPYDRRKHPSLGSTRNTFKVETLSQFYSHSRNRSMASRRDSNIWNESATAMTRNHSPQHSFPQQKRFSSLEEEKARSFGNSNRLNLRGELKSGHTFAISTRNIYFPPQVNLQNPSPWCYGIDRWLQEPQNPSTKFRRQYFQHLNPRAKRNCYSNTVRGRTITKQVRDNHKYYLDHARTHVNHHQQLVIDHPGVGKYSIGMKAGKSKPVYSFGSLFKQERNSNPAPNAYVNNPDRVRPSTLKGTFDRSWRLDLAKPLNENPGPSEYVIARYLQERR